LRQVRSTVGLERDAHKKENEMIGPAGFMAGPKKQEPEPPPADLRCCANCAHWHKKEYIHCQCSGPWGGNIFGDKNCTFRARKVRSNDGIQRRQRRPLE